MIEIKKNSFTRVMIEKCNYQGKDFIDIRQYFRDDEKNFKPSKKGVTIPLDKLDEFIKALLVIQAQEIKKNDSEKECP
ncbi:unnamed protein product [marine sediment metagenome]|uniref:Transcriptional coactivator p15 (PC4) C-terminal domain-containing protein n=1 Tax=marine sediment metagenome TaxID=412755 RepID=X1KX17_9ZZZZ